MIMNGEYGYIYEAVGML